MRLLYGDSTPSPLEGNFIEFLREALDFCVRALQAQQRISEHRERASGLTRDADATVARLEKLFGAVAASVQKISSEKDDAAVENCGAAIDRAAAELARAEAGRVRAALATEVAKLEAQSTAVRTEAVKSLEALLVKHDLPDTALRIHLRALGGTRYGARLLGTTPFGLELLIDLEIPPGHLFSSALRVDRVMERLDVSVPEANGRHKEARLRAQRLEKYYVSELAIGVTGSAVKLRETPDGAAGGFDFLFGDEGRIRVLRVGEREQASETLSDIHESDVAKLRSLCERLSAAASELGRHRRGLLEASLDGQALTEHERPALLVERLVQHIAPIVREIAARSSAPDELVLRRMLSEDRREEIFVSKSELARKFEVLPPALRGIFDPLGLGRPVERPASQPPRTQASPVVVGTIEAELPEPSVVGEKGPR